MTDQVQVSPAAPSDTDVPALRLRVVPALRRRENWQQLLRFAAVGGSGYALNLTVFALLVTGLDVDFRIAAAVAFLVAVTSNFTWNLLWTFGHVPGAVTAQAGRFLAVSLGGFVLNLLVLDVEVRALDVDALPAQAVAVLVVVPFSYVGNRLWTFADADASGALRTDRVLGLAVGCIAVLSGVGLLLLSAPHGVVLSSDSAAFTDAGRNLGAGHGLVLSGSYPNLEPTLHGASGFPLVHWAPLYPAALGAGEALGAPVVDTARYLAALLLAANLAMLGLLLWRTTRSRPVTALGVAVLAVSPIGLARHAAALSEPLFLLLALGGLELLARHLRSRRTSTLVAACGVLSLALLSRYAGLPLVLVVFIALLVPGQRPLRQRLLVATAAAAAVSLPLAVWLARNVHEAGTMTGRSGASWHPPGPGEIASAVGTVAQWLAPASLPQAPRALFAAVAGALLVSGVVSLRRASARPVKPSSDEAVRVFLLSAFVLSYTGFLLLSRSLMDAANPLNDRGFAPIYAGGIVIVTALVTRAVRTPRPRRLTAGSAAVLAGGVLVLGAYAQQTGAVATDLRHGEAAGSARAEGYLGVGWESSPTLAAVRRIPAGTVVYSNAPDAVLVATGIRAQTVPPRVDPIADSPYDGYLPGLAELRRQVQSGAAVVAWFDDVDRGYLPTLAQLRRAAGLQVLTATPDGTVLGR